MTFQLMILIEQKVRYRGVAEEAKPRRDCTQIAGSPLTSKLHNAN